MVAVQPSGGGDALLSGDGKRLCRALLLSVAIHVLALAAWLVLEGHSAEPKARAVALSLELRQAGERGEAGKGGAQRQAPRLDRSVSAGDRPVAARNLAAEVARQSEVAREIPGQGKPERQAAPSAKLDGGDVEASSQAGAQAKSGSAERAGVQSEGDSEALYAPKYLQNPRPVYPERSSQLGEEGVVTLSVRVGTDGRALAVSISRSSGYRRLDQAAADAVSRWRFVPAKRRGKPVESELTVPVRFEGEGR